MFIKIGFLLMYNCLIYIKKVNILFAIYFTNNVFHFIICLLSLFKVFSHANVFNIYIVKFIIFIHVFCVLPRKAFSSPGLKNIY